jgi:hypothetical protein
MWQTQICFLCDNFFSKIRILWEIFFFLKNIFWAIQNFTQKKTWPQNFYWKVPSTIWPAFLLLEKFRQGVKLKIKKWNWSEIEVFNCQISRENLVNDRCVTKNIERWLNFYTSCLVYSQIWLNFLGMIATFSASSYGWMTATLGTCKNSIKKHWWEHDTVQIMGEWEVNGNLPLSSP